MKNVYGTKEYNDKIEEYRVYIDSMFSSPPQLNEKSFLFGDFQIIQSVYSYYENRHSARRSILKILKCSTEMYAIDCLDSPMPPIFF